MDEMAERMARAVRWKERGLCDVLVAAERAASTLWRKKLPLEDFLTLGGRQNPYAALLLTERLKRSGQLCEEAAGRQREKLRKALQEEVLRKEAAARESGDPEPEAAKSSQAPASGLQNCSLLCAAALLLEDTKLLHGILLLFKREGTKEEAAALSREVFALLRYAPQELPGQIRLYRAFYDCLPIEWNTTAAYGQGVEILTPETLPAELKELILLALERGDLRYADLVLKVFVPVGLSQLGMTGDEFMERVFQTDSDNLFRGILFAEKLILQDAGSFLDGVERWRQALLAKCREENTAWQGLKGWFDMYYLCRRATACPEEAGEFLAACQPLTPGIASYQKTNNVQQEAFEALFLGRDKSILRLLQALGENNVFRFQSEEEYYPHYGRNPSYDLTKALQNLIAQGLCAEELLFVYMNTHLRCCYAMRAFLRLAFAQGEELKVYGMQASVERLFAPYRLVGRVGKWNGNFGFSTQNICMGTSLILFPAKWQQENEAFCQRMLEEEKPRSFHVTRLHVNSFSLRGLPDERPQECAGEGTEAFLFLCKELEAIEAAGVLTTRQNGRVSRAGEISGLDAGQLRRLGLLIVRCCAALGNDPRQLRYFLNMMNRLGNGKTNPWRHQVFCKESEWSRQTEAAKEETWACWKRLAACALAPEELFFAYINTLFKYCIPFSALAERCGSGDEGIVDLEPVISRRAKYYFSGRIYSVRPDGDAWLVGVRPDEFYQGPKGDRDTFYLRTQEPGGYKEGQRCQFEIRAYQTGRKNFFLKNILLRPDKRSIAARQVFLAAMNRAAYSERLSSRDLGDLGAQTAGFDGREAGKLALPMLNALKKRVHSITEINRYLAAAETNNPWRFDEKPLPDRRDWPDLAQGEQMGEACRRALGQLMEANGLHSVLRVYFNSVFKSYAGLDTLLSMYGEAKRGLASPALWMEKYPLVARWAQTGLQPVNFRLDHASLCLQPGEGPAEEGACRYFLAGYEEEAACVWLRKEGEKKV